MKHVLVCLKRNSNRCWLIPCRGLAKVKSEPDSWKFNLRKVNQDVESHLNVGLVCHASPCQEAHKKLKPGL